jgi:hypothetical protein
MIVRKSRHEFVVTVPSHTKDLIDWCTEHFGPGGRNKKFRWRYGWTNNFHYYFRSEQDALLFTLRWA